MQIWVCVYHHDHGTDVWVEKSGEDMNKSIIDVIKENIASDPGSYMNTRKALSFAGVSIDKVLGAYDKDAEGERFEVHDFVVTTAHENIRDAAWRRKAVRALRAARERLAALSLATEVAEIDALLTIDTALEAL